VKIAKQLRKRREFLSDRRNVRWVQRMPQEQGESCLILDGPRHTPGLSDEATDFLDWFLEEYANGLEEREDLGENWTMDCVDFNDTMVKSRDEVLWMLDEAADAAKEAGL